MTNTTRRLDAENLAVNSAAYQSRRDLKTVEDFKAKINGGDSIASAISWDATPVIVAEARANVAFRFLDVWFDDEATEEDAFEYLAHAADGARREVGYFDPTSQSTSASASFVDAAKFKANLAVIEFVEGLLRVKDEWV